MKLAVPFIQLPLAFDAPALAAEVARLGESAWRPHPQGFAGNEMLPLVAVEGDPANEGFAGPMRPTPALRACPALGHVIASLGAVVGRSRLMRLAGQAEVTRHADLGYYWAERVRVHVPLLTQPTVRFECGDSAVHMAAGECWIFDTWRQHRVLNDAVEARIHLVVDTVGGDAFWGLVGRGRAPGAVMPGWQARPVPTGAGTLAEFPLEQWNVPTVMAPWEINAHFGLLFEDAVAHPALPGMQALAAAFLRSWRALWARHGEADGFDEYRRVLDGFVAGISELAAPVRLRNDTAWLNAMMNLVGLVALRQGAGAAPVASAGSASAALADARYGIADRA